MQALPTELAPATAGSNRAQSDRRRRWRDAATDMLGPAAVLAATWTLFQIAIDLRNGKQGGGLVAWNAIGTLFMISILVALAAVVEVSALGARVRTFAMVGAGIVAAAVGLGIFFP